jgi:hypothetical protein
MTQIPVADAVKVLRKELESAIDAAENSSLRFELGPIELEFHAVFTTAGNGEMSAGFKLLAFTAGGKVSGKIENEQIQKLKITLTPKRVIEGRPNPVDLSR